MAKEVFLVCALALAPLDKAAELRKLRDFLQNQVPNAEFNITPHDQELPKDQGWERTPLEWNHKQIWIKRPTVYDRRRRRA